MAHQQPDRLLRGTFRRPHKWSYFTSEAKETVHSFFNSILFDETIMRAGSEPGSRNGRGYGHDNIDRMSLEFGNIKEIWIISEQEEDCVCGARTITLAFDIDIGLDSRVHLQLESRRKAKATDESFVVVS